MARGQRKTIEEKITAKEELIEALMTRVESEKKELEAVNDLITESGLEPEEVVEVLQQYLENRENAAS